MDPQIAWKIAIVSGGFALAGALISQLITALFNLKIKRLEIVFARKVDTYKNLMEKAGAFANDTTNAGRYLEFIHAYYATLIIASPAVLQAFASQESITNITARMQGIPTDKEEQEKLTNSWQKAMDALTSAMREDLRQFSKR